MLWTCDLRRELAGVEDFRTVKWTDVDRIERDHSDGRPSCADELDLKGLAILVDMDDRSDVTFYQTMLR